MPLIRPEFPSLALGLLTSILHRNRIRCADFPFYLDFMEAAGPDQTLEILKHDASLAGDYIFSGELEPRGLDEADYVRRLVRRRALPPEDAPGFRELLRGVRREVVPAFLDRMMEHDWGRYGLVGFTSTFQQQAASLALARRIKRSHPDVPIVLGGANAWGDMGVAWLEAMPFLDYVCTGEGDATLPELFRSLQRGEPPGAVTNLAWRRGGKVVLGPERPTSASMMNSLPRPNYRSYFRRAKQVHVTPTGVTFEASRGCWWGEKKHCVFCGLNNSGMAYRAKSWERVYDELKALSRRYGQTSFYAVDNILDRRYLHTLFPRLDEDRSDLSLFFEIKSNMTLDEIRLMRRAGVTEVQPGIESLSSEILRLMGKGVTGIRNVFLLKWAKYFGISAEWNLLSGFYREEQRHYDQQARWMRNLFHLDPPIGRLKVVLQRYTPLFDSPDRFGIANIRPNFMYEALYPDASFDRARIAYYFDHDASGRLPDGAFTEVDDAIAEWKSARDRGSDGPATLAYRRSPAGFLEIEDTRAAAAPSFGRLTSPQAEVFEMAGLEPVSAAGLARDLAARYGWSLSAQTVTEYLKEFVEAGMAIDDGNLFLTLALPVSRRFFDPPARGPHAAGPQARTDAEASAGVALPLAQAPTPGRAMAGAR